MSEQKSVDPRINEFMQKLYDINSISESDFRIWVESYSYKGFDREKILKDLITKISDVKIVQQIILICGLNGPVKAANTKLINGRTVESYGIPASGMKGSTNVSCQRITASTADLCAYLLKKANVPKRIDCDLPGWLQFPGAGSISLPTNYREQHIEFSKKFSPMIGGKHNEKIYWNMQANSYLNDKLQLF